MSSPLDKLASAHAARIEAEGAEQGALREARDAGATLQAIADVLGLTRAGVLHKLKQAGAHVPAKVSRAQKRLEVLDARWDKLVDTMAATMVHPDAQREQLRRNQQNGKQKRKNARAASAASKRGFAGTRGVPMIPTVSSETRRAAEAKLVRLVEDHVDDPRFAGIVAELAEAETLRSELAQRLEPSWLHD